jgi:hypothetical protein
MFKGMKNRIVVHITCIRTLYYITHIYTHMTGYIKKHLLKGRFKGFSELILTICDFGIMSRLYNVNHA